VYYALRTLDHVANLLAYRSSLVLCDLPIVDSRALCAILNFNCSWTNRRNKQPRKPRKQLKKPKRVSHRRRKSGRKSSQPGKKPQRKLRKKKPRKQVTRTTGINTWLRFPRTCWLLRVWTVQICTPTFLRTTQAVTRTPMDTGLRMGADMKMRMESIFGTLRTQMKDTSKGTAKT
jgi:hypothetical protein